MKKSTEHLLSEIFISGQYLYAINDVIFIYFELKLFLTKGKQINII